MTTNGREPPGSTARPVIGSVSPSEAREFLTDTGLTTPDSTASFNVDVVLCADDPQTW